MRDLEVGSTSNFFIRNPFNLKSNKLNSNINNIIILSNSILYLKNLTKLWKLGRFKIIINHTIRVAL